METEKLHLMLEAIKMNPEAYKLLIKDVAFKIMLGVYPEYGDASNRTFKEQTGFGNTNIPPAASVDFQAEKQALDFVDKLVSLGDLSAIKLYCSEHGLQDYYPDETEYIQYHYKEITKPL